jgi:hypothetical protein
MCGGGAGIVKTMIREFFIHAGTTRRRDKNNWKVSIIPPFMPFEPEISLTRQTTNFDT